MLEKLLRVLAYQIGSEVSLQELAIQLRVKQETVGSDIDLLEKSFVLYQLKSYATTPRKELSKKSKIYFWDKGIRNCIIGDFRNLSIRNDQGKLFDNFIISERQKMNSLHRPMTQSFLKKLQSKRSGLHRKNAGFLSGL